MSDGALPRPTELAHSLVACVLRPGEVAVDATAGNGDLVPASIEQLTYKQVQKGRKGRRFSLRIMQKVARALNVAIWTPLPDEKKEQFVGYQHSDLFSYAKGFREPLGHSPCPAGQRAVRCHGDLPVWQDTKGDCCVAFTHGRGLVLPGIRRARDGR